MSSLDAMRVPKQVLWMIFDYVFDGYLSEADLRGRNAMLGEIKTVCNSWRRATVNDDMFMIGFLNKRASVYRYDFRLEPGQHQPMGSFPEGTRVQEWVGQWDADGLREAGDRWDDTGWGGI
jgi:hypothetical protein